MFGICFYVYLALEAMGSQASKLCSQPLNTTQAIPAQRNRAGAQPGPLRYDCCHTCWMPCPLDLVHGTRELQAHRSAGVSRTPSPRTCWDQSRCDGPHLRTWGKLREVREHLRTQGKDMGRTLGGFGEDSASTLESVQDMRGGESEGLLVSLSVPMRHLGTLLMLGPVLFLVLPQGAWE